MGRLFLIVTTLFSISVAADQMVNCGYKMFGAEVWRVQVLVYSNGEPASSVQVIQPGSSVKQPNIPLERSEDQLVHLLIGKGNPEELVKMIVYKEIKREGQSLLINPKAPIMGELWGECSITDEPTEDPKGSTASAVVR